MSTTSGGRQTGWRRSWSEPFEIGQPELDERPDRVFEARFPRQLQRLLVAAANLFRSYALLEAVVSGDQEFVDLLTWVVICHKLHPNL